MMKSLSVIRRSVGSRSLAMEQGFIANSSDSWLLVTVITDNFVSGLSLFRRDTIVSIEDSVNAQLVRRSLLLSGCIVPDSIDLPIQTAVSAMRWLMSERLICGIYREAEGSDFASFGKITRIAEDVFDMREISPSGDWDDGPMEYGIADCTRVTFLGKYELGLMRYSLDAAESEIGGQRNRVS